MWAAQESLLSTALHQLTHCCGLVKGHRGDHLCNCQVGMSVRQSGRTTKMLQEAAEAQQWGHVLIISPNRSIEEHCRRLALQLGLSLHRTDFAGVHSVLNGKYRGFSGKIFCDHTCWEFPTASVQERLQHEINLITMPVVLTTEAAEVKAEEEERQRLREQLRQEQAISN